MGMPVVVLLASDLMMASRVGAIGRQHGVRLHSISSAEGLLQLPSSTRPACILIDLQTPGLYLADVQAAIEKRLTADQSQSESNRGATAIIAYAPHIYKELLASGRSIPQAEVLSRGQLTRQLPQLIASFAGPAPVAAKVLGESSESRLSNN